ncbi:MAG TPA: inositol monophosphatase family protein [Acidimicrobiia bacterium]
MTDDHLDLDALLSAAVDAALVGGRVVRSAFGDARNVREKRPGDLVSDTDYASERAIREVLTHASPDIAFVGEEEGGERAEVGWFVDPLDGTANFVHGFPVVGVSVALVVGGEPVVGVVHAPMLDDLYTAVRGGGASRNGEAIRVSDRPIASAIAATGFPFRAKRQRLGEYLPVFERAIREFEDLRRAGSASLDLAWTAAGVLDGYFEQALATWDVAAGALLVREAGGVVTDWRGDRGAWLASGDIVAGPRATHARLLELIADAVASTPSAATSTG